ncbi:hypothetical protein SAVIM40S_00204 [Streptomyces avidinii]
MEEYAGRILAGRYRLPLPPSDEYELIETRAFDMRSGRKSWYGRCRCRR